MRTPALVKLMEAEYDASYELYDGGFVKKETHEANDLLLDERWFAIFSNDEALSTRALKREGEFYHPELAMIIHLAQINLEKEQHQDSIEREMNEDVILEEEPIYALS